MKKFFLVVVLLLLLCGCQKTKPEYLVSSIGFDKKQNNYTVFFETVNVK